MARPSKADRLYTKSESAMIAAIEVYNKPTFAYREETFSILAINAWELLLKARILSENENQLRSIYVLEHKQKADGSKSARMYPKVNRAGNRVCQTNCVTGIFIVLPTGPARRQTSAGSSATPASNDESISSSGRLPGSRETGPSVRSRRWGRSVGFACTCA